MPLTLDHLRKLNDGERRLIGLLPEIERCERCGLDMTTVRKALEEQMTVIRNLKTEFFPNNQVRTSTFPSRDG